MKIKNVLGVLAVATTAAIAVPTAATADAFGDCSTGWVCLYENEDFNAGKGSAGDHWRNFRQDQSDFRDFSWRQRDGGSSGDNMDNETSAIRNRIGRCVTLFQDVGFTGDRSEFEPGPSGDDGALANNNVGDNRASALLIGCPL